MLPNKVNFPTPRDTLPTISAFPSITISRINTYLCCHHYSLSQTPFLCWAVETPNLETAIHSPQRVLPHLDKPKISKSLNADLHRTLKPLRHGFRDDRLSPSPHAQGYALCKGDLQYSKRVSVKSCSVFKPICSYSLQTRSRSCVLHLCRHLPLRDRRRCFQAR